LGVSQITGVCFTHVTLFCAVFFLFTAYTERAFLLTHKKNKQNIFLKLEE